MPLTKVKDTEQNPTTTTTPANMATVIGPSVPKPHGRLELPLHRLKYRRRETDADSEQRRAELREEALQRGEEVSRGRARAYLNDFLQKSEWGNRMNQFTVMWDAVPTMEELESYGDLNETEGTQACRKLFKAVVVWDELGHSLWERLKITCKQKKDALRGLGPLLMKAPGRDERSSDASEDSISRQRSSSRESGKSRRRASSQHSSKRNRTARSKTLPLPGKASFDNLSAEWNKLPEYSHFSDEVDQSSSTSSLSEKNDQESRPGIPKIISHNCASAVRKVFGEGRSSGNGAQRNR